MKTNAVWTNTGTQDLIVVLTEGRGSWIIRPGCSEEIPDAHTEEILARGIEGLVRDEPARK